MQGSRSPFQKDFIRLVFVGSPLLDITAHCDPELVARYDLKADGCTVATQRHDTLFHHLLSDPKSTMDAGGSALNSAKIAKWVAGDKGRVSFIGCVGDDDGASRLFEYLRSDGVEPLFASVPGVSTGTCACLLTFGGECRSLCTRRGAAALFRKDHLNEDIRERLLEADCVFAAGYLLAHSLDVLLELASKRRPDQIFALSLSAEYVCRDFKKDLLEVLPGVDILLGNEIELMALVDTLRDCTTVEEAASFVANWKRPRIVIVSRGPGPVVFVKGGEASHHFPVPRDVSVLNTVGCGDALAGAFLAVYAFTGDPDEAVRAGIAAAAEIAQTPGCRPPPKRLVDILK